jgi:Pvc16 N-terminal domain
MSNYLAIATVSAALQQILLGPVQNAVSGANVGFNRPNGKNAGQKGPVVNLYLYRVTPNAAYRNVDLPTRRGDGTLVKKPLTALDLHYLFTFHGSDEKLEPQRMLGAVASALDVQPLLSTQNIQSAITSAQFSSFLASSDLASQLERVRFTPTALSLEEFTKLWSAFFQVEYSLSAAYQASVVLIESDDTPQEALPVQSRNIYVLPFEEPVITQVMSQAGAGQPILPTSTLVIQGSNLLSDVTATTVQLGNVVVTPVPPAKVTNTTITMPVPAGVQAGVLGVQVMQQLQVGTPPQPHSGFDSNVVAMVLHPIITPGTVSSTQITVNITPVVQPGQRVTLLLNEAKLPPPPSPPAAYAFTFPPPTASTSTLNFAITGVQAGGTKYFIRVAIDGAESLLDLDPTSPTFGPTVTIT